MNKLTCLATAGAVALSLNSAVQADTIADVAMSNDQFSTLVTAVKAAGLPPALKGKGPLTVFAPTNAAFAKLPKGTVQMLLKPENKSTLVKILTYHVVPGRVSGKKVMGMMSGANVKTLQGEKLAIRMGNGVMLDPFYSGKARVTKTDVKASNGVIHVIDTVLIPPSVARAMAKR
ncbi:MAG TPA: fasciclin domain-containing protein [Abditibacteriaceae bacterium]|jgi:uncharacterized surface protein with fasciclin (FAS1) repeats